MDLANLKICIRGAGELASAVAHRLRRCNFKVLLTEIANPQAVRRQVAFCEAVHHGSKEVEGVLAKLVSDSNEVEAAWRDGTIPLIVDPETRIKSIIKPDVLIESGSHSEEDLLKTKEVANSISCKVIVMPNYPEQSSSKIKEEIKNNIVDSNNQDNLNKESEEKIKWEN